jgi:hypothetical protein
VFKFADCKGGFPHSEIFGSQGARASPKLIAACHVLHRLSTPRHPSEALMRLIVLSKTHAWGSVFAWPAVRRTGQAPTHALRFLSLQTMMSSRIHPGASYPPGEAEGGRIDPSIHDVRFAAGGSKAGTETCSSAIALADCLMVESDGIEPTTSCLQSTRSTN